MIQRLLPLMLLAVLVGCQTTTSQPIQKPAQTTAPAPIPAPEPAPQSAANPVIEIVTDKGMITVELFAKTAPGTVKNFLRYVDEKHFDNLVFHRVMKTFMIQGGGFATNGIQRRPKYAPVVNEADNGVANDRYTIAMARTGDPHSATAQFFINTKNNTMLDHTSKTMHGWGYCAFGKVIAGKKVVDTIAAQPVGPDARGEMSKPKTPVVIKTIQRKK